MVAASVSTMKKTRGLYHVFERRYFSFSPGRFSEIVAIITAPAVTEAYSYLLALQGLFTIILVGLLSRGLYFGKYTPPPRGERIPYRPMSFGGKNMKRLSEKRGKCKRKRKKEGKKERKGKENEKKGSKRVK